MIQNIQSSYGSIASGDSFKIAPINNDSSLVSIPLDSNFQYSFSVDNQNQTFDWQITITGETVDTGCNGTMSILGSLINPLDQEDIQYVTIDSIQVVDGEFAANDRTYVGALAPNNFPFLSIIWDGTAVTAEALLKVIIGM